MPTAREHAVGLDESGGAILRHGEYGAELEAGTRHHVHYGAPVRHALVCRHERELGLQRADPWQACAGAMQNLQVVALGIELDVGAARRFRGKDLVPGQTSSSVRIAISSTRATEFKSLDWAV